MTDQEKQAHLSGLVKAARESLKAAEAFAIEHKLEFSFNPAYGMGGTFIGDPEEYAGLVDYADEGATGWYSSSMGC